MTIPYRTEVTETPAHTFRVMVEYQCGDGSRKHIQQRVQSSTWAGAIMALIPDGVYGNAILRASAVRDDTFPEEAGHGETEDSQKHPS